MSSQSITQMQAELDAAKKKIVELEQALAAQVQAEYRELSQSVIDVIDERIAVIDDDGNITHVNEPWLRFATENGCDEPEGKVIHVNYLDVLESSYLNGDESVLPIIQGIKDVLNGSSPVYESEYPCGSPAGMGWFIMKVRRLPRGGAAISHQDVTRRKQSEIELMENERRMRQMFAKHNAIMLLIEPESGSIIRANSAALKFYGYSLEQMQQMRIHEINMLSPEEIALRLSQAVTESLSVFVFPHRLASGEVRSVEVHSSPIDLDGKIVLFSILHDVTDRLRTQQALHESEMKFSAAFHTSPLSITLAAADGKFVEANQAFCDLTGYPRQEIIGRTIHELGNMNEEMLQAVHRSIAMNSNKSVNGFEIELRHKDGGLKHVLYSINPVMIDGAMHFMGTGLDITERTLAKHALRHSEEKYRVLVESLDSAVLVLDSDLRYEYVSEKVAQNRGRTVQDFLGKNVLADFPESFRPELEARLRKILQEKRGEVIEEPIIIGEEPRWHLTSLQPIFDEHGRAVSILINSTDIHEVKKIQHELQELNRSLDERVKERTAQLQDLYDHAPAGYHSLDANGNFISINQTELDWLGYSREELIGKPLSAVVEPIREPTFKERFLAFKTTGSLKDVEIGFKRKNGSLFTVLANATAIYDAEGNFQSSRSTLLDITERKLAEQALRESEIRFRSIFENSLNGILWTDPNDARIISANPAACRLWGGTEPELVQLGRGGLLDLSDPRLPAALEIRARTGGFSGELNLRHKDGSIFPTELSSAIFTTPNGEQVATVVFSDITDRKQAEDTLLRANHELERLVRIKDEFLANTSHELRTPLNAILGISESLLEQIVGPLNEKQMRYIGVIQESGQHLLELINDILDLSKAGAGKLTMEPARITLDRLAQSSLRLVRELSIKKQQTISLEMDPEINVIWADERRLKQMLVNLLSNAVKFTPPGGRLGLEIRGNRQDEQILLTVWDTGIGIGPSDLAQIFEPFVQLDAGLAREQSGTGLGLTLVAEMARLHGGSVKVESEPGVGSRFSIILPWIEVDANFLEQNTLEDSPGHGALQVSGPGSSRRTILLVEDIEATSLVTWDYLESNGYHVILAMDGREGVTLAKSIHPDLILMDVQMPMMDGMTATKMIRAEAGLETTPIIALTALAMPGDRERCLAAGMSDYFSKPVSLRKLLQTIKKLLGAGPGASA